MKKEEIEFKLRELLNEALQENCVLELDYDEEMEECRVKLSVHIAEAFDYVGFQVF